MENNIIIRHAGLLNEESFDNMTAEFTEAFEGFDGVTVVTTTENNVKDIKIYLSEDNRIYLHLYQQSGYGMRAAVRCSGGSTEGVNYAYIDNRELNVTSLAYSIAKTDYGVAFTTMPHRSECLTDGYFQSFFTTFLKQDGTRINGFVYSAYPNDDISRNTNPSYMVTEMHQSLERFDFTKCMFGTESNHTVLTNMTSYSYPLIAEHLFKKIMTENSRFGRIMINNRSFVSGSHLCLEMGSSE